MSRIWFDSIKSYADKYHICDEDFDVFHTLIRAMDDEYIAVETERQKAESEKNKIKE